MEGVSEANRKHVKPSDLKEVRMWIKSRVYLSNSDLSNMRTSTGRRIAGLHAERRSAVLQMTPMAAMKKQ